MILILRSLIFPLWLGVGLLAPGWLLGRALRTPPGWVGIFLGSAALLMNLLLGLDAADVALTGPHVATGLAGICAILAVIAKLRGAPSPAPVAAAGPGFRWQRHHWFLLPMAIGLAAVALKASLDPLSGFDTIFRWDFLAQQMLRESSLHFYPAVTAEDFLRYGWCDGIAPLVSSLYFWTYLSLGSIAAGATAPVVIGQAVLLSLAVYQLASERTGAAAGWAATAVLATGSVLLWGVAMGQETGLTALALVAMFLFIERHDTDPAGAWLVWAGIAAGVGGLAREYGLAYVALGGFALAWRRWPISAWLKFTLAAMLTALPWFIRNWLKTGNPLYSHDLGGLFPTNPVSVEYFQSISRWRGLGTDASELPDLARLLGYLAGIPLVLGLAGAVLWRGKGIPLLGALLGVVALWLWSIGQTSGGAVYSLRVLTPALALAAVLAGGLVARWTATRYAAIVIVVLTLLAIDAGRRSLFLPIDPYVAWWKWRASAWLDFRETAERWNNQPGWAGFARSSHGQQIIVTDPYSYSLLLKSGASPVTIFSPAVRFLFEPDLNYAACLARLRAAKVRFVLLPPTSAEITNGQLLQHSFFSTLLSTRPAQATPGLLIYDLHSPAVTDLPTADLVRKQP